MTDANLKNQPRVVATLAIVVAGFLVGQVVASVVDALLVAALHYPGGLNALSSASAPPWWSNVAGLSGLWVGFAGAIIVVHQRLGLVAWPHAWRLRATDVLYLLLGVGCQIVVGLAYAPFQLKNLNKPVTHLFGSAHGATFALLATMTVVGAPIVEEWLFRGVVFRTLVDALSTRRTRGGVVAAIVISALLFALAHGEWLQFPGLFFLGVVLAIVAWRTQRLATSALTHIGFNALTMGSLIVQRAHH